MRLIFTIILSGFIQISGLSQADLSISTLFNNCKDSKKGFDSSFCCRIDLLKSILHYQSSENKWPDIQTIKDSCWNKCGLDLSSVLLSCKHDTLIYSLGVFENKIFTIRCIKDYKNIKMSFYPPAQKQDTLLYRRTGKMKKDTSEISF